MQNVIIRLTLFKEQKEDQSVDGHNCYSSGICQTKWGMLGCICNYQGTTKLSEEAESLL